MCTLHVPAEPSQRIITNSLTHQGNADGNRARDLSSLRCLLKAAKNRRIKKA